MKFPRFGSSKIMDKGNCEIGYFCDFFVFSLNFSYCVKYYAVGCSNKFLNLNIYICIYYIILLYTYACRNINLYLSNLLNTSSL